MALIHWEPVAELNSIQNEMNRLFNTLFDQPRSSSATGTSKPRWVPPMDLVEIGDQYVLSTDLPGLSENEIDITFQDGVLTISGERKAVHGQNSDGYLRLERPFGTFSRSLSLPDGVDAGSLQARFDRGVLSISIPKPQQSQPRKVTIGGHEAGEIPAIDGTEMVDEHANGREPASAPA